MKIRKIHLIGIIFSVLIFTVDFIFFRSERIFFFLVGIGIVVVTLPFLATIIIERNVQKEKNDRFLDFSRNLAESVKTGNPIGKSILNMRTKNFGSLTPHIQKLANQISLGIPINKALEIFAEDIDSLTIRRAVALIGEAEEAGGEIDDILESVATSIYQIDKLKKERKAAIYNLVVQGYVIFFIFIGIMLMMQFKILPLTADVSSFGSLASISQGGLTNTVVSNVEDISEGLTRPFLYLLIVQGFFAGLTIGKLAEGSIKAGIKHSFVMAIAAFLISTGANAFV